MSINLLDLLPQPTTVDLGRGKVQVHGLTLDHVAKLFQERMGELAPFFNQGEGSEPNLLLLAQELPGLAVQLIAMGLRCEGQEEQVKLIPVATQVDILMDIWKLSVPDAKKSKARLEELLAAIKSLAPAALPATRPSTRPLPSASNSLSPTDTDSNLVEVTPSGSFRLSSD